MNISKEEAAQALGEIDSARRRSEGLRNYRHFAPYMITWGIVWACANALADFQPANAGWIWMVGVAAGTAASAWLGMRQHNTASDGNAAPGLGRRCALLFAVITGFFIATFAVLPPTNGARANAFISLFWMFCYMVAGVWLGWKIFAIGFLTTLLTLVGLFTLEGHFALWMAFCGGGALIGGGLWLHRA